MGDKTLPTLDALRAVMVPLAEAFRSAGEAVRVFGARIQEEADRDPEFRAWLESLDCDEPIELTASGGGA